MPENGSRKLTLHSPAGSEHATYPWPFVKSGAVFRSTCSNRSKYVRQPETWDEAMEIVETIRWVCQDFPELKLAVENYVLNDFDPGSFDSMKQLCERYNRAIDNIRKLWSGRQPPDCIDSAPCLPLLKHIMNQVYNRAVTNPDALNSYEPFSPEVYGETSFELVAEVIKHTHLMENDVFVDLGSGIGQVVLQVAAATGCKCIGIEKAETPALYAQEMEREFVKWMDWYGKSYGDFELHTGDFLDSELSDIINSATVIFVNNFAFGPKLNHELKMKFSNLPDGTKIVSSHEFCPLNFRVTTRNLSDIGSMMHVAELSLLKGHVSWTGKPVTYYLHIIDRGKLEKFFRRQKHPNEFVSDESSRSPTPCSEQGRSTGGESRSVAGEGKSVGSERVGVGRGGRSGGARKSDKVLASDDSEESTLDSSDNDFEEQIKRMKTNQQMQHSTNQKKSAHAHCDTPPPHLTPQPPTPSSDAKDHSSSLATPTLKRERDTSQKSAKKYRRTLVPGQKSAVGGGEGVHARKPGRAGKKERKKVCGVTESGLPGQEGVSKRRALPGNKGGPMEGLFASIQEQLSSYVQQLGSTEHQNWVREAIKKEKLKQQHLQVVIQHLKSEVSSLAKETIAQMEKSMSQLGITTFSPEGLLVGAKSIVHHNKKLRIEMKELEKDLDTLRGHNDVMKLLCKEKKVFVPKPNVCPPGGLPSTSSEPRVPPLPSELIAAPAASDDTMTSSPGNTPSSGKRRKCHIGGKSSGIHPLILNEQQQQHEQKGLAKHQQELSVHPPLHMSKLHSLGKWVSMTVKETTRAGMGEDLAKELKECKIDLERIDQELLELGPFAKDMYHDPSSMQKSGPNTLPLPGTVVPPRVPPLMSPPEVLIGIHQYQQQRQSPLRRSRKISQQTSNGKIGGKDAKRRSEDGYVSSPMSASSISLGEERTELHLVPERFLGREKEGGTREQQQKGKWRKVGSAGSPVIPPCSSKTTTTTSCPHSSLGSSNSSSPLSDSSHTLPPASTTAKVQITKPHGTTGGGGKGLDSDVSSPSMIPAASEIEMLSLYMPNSPWETIGSSPLHPEHDSTTDVQAAIGSSSTAERVVDYHYKTASDVLDPRSESIAHGPSQTGSRNEKSSCGEDYQKLHSIAPVFVASTNTHGNSNWPSPLATSVARHSPGQLVAVRPECRGDEPTPLTADTLRMIPLSVSPGIEFRRHVAVRDGLPGCMSSTSLKSGFSVTQLTIQDQQQQQHFQNMSVPHGVIENRSAIPVERISPPVSNTVGTHHPHHFGGIDVSSVKHRRSSSSSSIRSFKQHQLSFDEGLSSSAQLSPLPTHTRVSVPRQTSSPLTQQALQQMQLLGGGPMGEVKSLNNVLGGGESAKLAMMNAAGGVSWLPCSTATAASQLQGQPNFLGPQTSITAAASAMNAAGLSCYPFPNPFLPGGSWLPTAGGMLASTGLPHQLQPPMFSLDPNSAYKQVFNPALIPYHYPLVTQHIKNFPSTSTQVEQSPSALSGSNLKQTPARTSTPHSSIGPNANRSAFHSVATELGGVGAAGSRTCPTNSATPPLLCLPPTQPQAFPGMLSPAQVLTTGGKDDNNGSNNNSKVAEASVAPQGLNWMQNPAALMGSAAGFNVMPYLMGQAQLGIAGPPGTQQALNMFNAPLHSDVSLTQVGGGAGMATAIPSSQDHSILLPRKPQPQRRGSSASVDLVRGEISPSNTPPLGMGPGGGVGVVSLGGAKKPQYPIMIAQDVGGSGMWKPAGDQTVNPPIVIHSYEYPSPDAICSTAPSFSTTSAMHMVNPSGHMMQAGFPSMTGTHLPSKGRGEMMLSHGSPRISYNDKPKLRIHHVRNDDFKLPVKPDRRRKRWRGKNKESFLSTRAELAEASLHRMGKLEEPLITSIPPFPASMAVEPCSNKVDVHIVVSEKHVPQREASTLSIAPHTTIPGSKDGNYALNMLADMSSIQSNKEKHEGNTQTQIPSGGNSSCDNGDNNLSEITPTSSSSNSSFRHHLRSPVSLAARSLLMLGEDLSQSHDDKPSSQDVTHVENTAATSLLQLSGAMLSGNEESQTKPSDTSQNQRDGETAEDTEGRSTCSASFSAAEAMIMMGATTKSSRDATSMAHSYVKIFESSQHNQSLKSTDDVGRDSIVGTMERQEGGKPGSTGSKPGSLTFDSEVTDSDSEATLTPSPNARKDHSSFPTFFANKNEGSTVTGQELHSHSPLDGESRRLDCLTVESNLQKCGNGLSDSSEIDVGRCHVLACPTSTTCASPKMIISDQTREGDMTCITKDYWSMTDSARVCTSELNHSDSSKLDVHLRDFCCSVAPPSALSLPASLTVAGTFTPPTLLSNKLSGDNDQDLGKDKSPLAKRPKFISTFGPVSENKTYPTLPLKIDSEDDVDGPESVLLPQDNLSPGVADSKTSKVTLQPSTEREMDTLPTCTKENSNISVKRKENERAIPIDRKEDNSCESDSSHQNEKHLERETNSDDDDGGGSGTEITPSQAESTTTTTSPCKKKEIASSGLEKEKTKHQLIAIKTNSKMSTIAAISLAPPTVLHNTLSDSKSRSLPSWTAFADSVDQDDTNCDNERGRKAGEHVLKMQSSEELSGGSEGSNDQFDSKPSHLSSSDGRLPGELNIETSKVEVDGSISSSSCSSVRASSDVTCDFINSTRDTLKLDPTAMAVAPQNRLVISRSPKQHRKRGAKLLKPSKNKGVTKCQQEQKAKDLFDVEQSQLSETMSKREMAKRGNESEKEKIFSQQSSNKSTLSHSKQKISPCSEELEQQHQHQLVDLYSGSPAREGTISHTVCDSDTISSTTKSRMWNQTSPGTDNRVLEQEFSPLSDDDEMTMPTSPIPCRVSMSKDSSKWSEVEDWERKRMRWHQGEFADSGPPLVPSPSSSTSSSGAKKHHSHHHHRHHERHPRGGMSKHDFNREKSASTSRGSSPTEHKKHHRHHYHPSHHHTGYSRDEERSLDGSSKRPSLEGTPKDEIFIEAASHLGKEDWHDSSGSIPGSGRCRKRMHINSDEDDKSLPEFSGGGALSVPCSRRRIKHRDHKERWKESNKHKHGGHKH